MARLAKDWPESRGRVLIIDDQPTNLRLLALLLSGAGYTVVTAASGVEGLAMVLATDPDVVLLDVRMPGMDGFEVLARLRAKPDLEELPVIFLTADNDRENLIRAYVGGVADYVTKPFVSQELLARVRTHVTLKRLRNQVRTMLQATGEGAGQFGQPHKRTIYSGS